MDEISTSDYRFSNPTSDGLAIAEADNLSDDITMTHNPGPKKSTLRFLRQMARCCVSTPGVSIPALSTMMAN